MIVSYKWLQTYFKDALPTPSKVADAFTFGAFEVEGMEEVKGAAGGKAGGGAGDTAIDLKVLPDRACYALSHRGVAYELSAILDQKSTVGFAGIGGEKADDKKTAPEPEAVTCDEKVSVTVTDKTLCRRYCARYIKNVKVSGSPDWLREKLAAVGQRSINTIVDATNFVMLDMGQPLHAFDADKLKGGIVVRLAKAGEIIDLLPEKGIGAARNIALQETDLVIADDAGPVAIAGVKGGMRAAVTDTTRNLVIESANFDPTAVRKTSTRLALRNDASKRFENNLTVDFAPMAMEEVTAIIKKLDTDISVGAVTDVLSAPAKQTKIEVSSDFISARLGVKLTSADLENVFERLQITFEKKSAKESDVYVLTIPPARLDINIPEDMVEEVGRIYGYDKIAPAIPPKVPASAYTSTPANNFAYWIEKVKDALFDLGFSEVQTGSFTVIGNVEIQNPLDSTRRFARSNLYENFNAALERNGRNAYLLGSNEVKIFEIGTVFDKENEHTSLAVGACVVKSTATKNTKEMKQRMTEIVSKAFDAISSIAGKKIEVPKSVCDATLVTEINLSEIIATLPAPTTWDIKSLFSDIKYKPFSIYPFMVRDVAVFVPSTISEGEVSAVIDATAGPLMIRHDLFDVFTKKFDSGEEKTSYAFHLVFQSYERTLVEDEINVVMKNVSEALTAKGWQVR